MRFLLTWILTSLISHAAEIKEEEITHSGAKFRIVRIQPQKLQLVWKGEDGQPYRTFDKVQDAFAKKGKTIRFLMNAGIFEPGGIPSGLHIEDGKHLLPLNSKDGYGNFFLKPNGIVSLWDDGTAAVNTLPGGQQPNLKRTVCRWAAQSGPLLLIEGNRHPAFRQNSDSKLHRNGIGIDQTGNLVCAITDSDQRVNFWDFSGLFLKLNCKDALFLDGDISQMVVNPTKPIESNPFGAIFVVAD